MVLLLGKMVQCREIITSKALTLFWVRVYSICVGWRGGTLPPPCWFSLNNSKPVEAFTLAFCNIQQHFIRDIHAEFGIPNLFQSPDIEQN